MIICEFINDKIRLFQDQEKEQVVLTLFPSPGNNGQPVFCVDQVISREEYQAIGKLVDDLLEDLQDIFSELQCRGLGLFRYLERTLKNQLIKNLRICRAVEKCSTLSKPKNINFFLDQPILRRMLENRGHSVFQQIHTEELHNNTPSHFRWKEQLVSLDIIHSISGLFESKPNPDRANILWMGSRSQKTRLPRLLSRNYNLFVLPDDRYQKYSMIARGIPFTAVEKRELSKLKIEAFFDESLYSKLRVRGKPLGLDTQVFTMLGIRPEKFRFLGDICESVSEKIEDLDLLIVEQSVKGVNQLLVDLFKQAGKRSLEILHGIPARAQVGSTDKIAVHGLRDIDFLSERGVSDDKLTATGVPRYESYFKLPKQERTKRHLLLALDPVDYIETDYGYLKIADEATCMLRVLHSQPEQKLLIKFHPSQDDSEIRYVNYLVERSPDAERVEAIREGDLKKLLAQAVIVYSGQSSVGIEALLLDKPVIGLPYPGKRTVYYDHFGAGFSADSCSDVNEYTDEILKSLDQYSEERKEELMKAKRYFSEDLKGKASENVLRVIQNLLNTEYEV
jgi:hypothetical protein